MVFDLPKEQSSIIKVIGVGGGGSNAVNYMYSQGIRGVNFVVCNTDSQALESSPIPNKIQLGPFLTEGLGAGADPEIGKRSAEESIEDIKKILEKNTKMVFITAGMGGGTGTGGAPVVAKIAKEMGILTVGIVTRPFRFEGSKRLKNAEEGIEAIRQYVDSLIIISNDRVLEIYKNLKRSEAFGKANDILTTAAKSTSEIITYPGEINVDFADVQSVMRNGGVALMGHAIAFGEDRAKKAVEEALKSPLLNDNNIYGAKKVLINIIAGKGDFELGMSEIADITSHVEEAAGEDAEVFFGTSDDDSLGESISVTIIATGFEMSNMKQTTLSRKPETTNIVADAKTITVTETTLNTTIEKVVVNFTNEVEAPEIPSVPEIETVSTAVEETLYVTVESFSETNNFYTSIQETESTYNEEDENYFSTTTNSNDVVSENTIELDVENYTTTQAVFEEPVSQPDLFGNITLIIKDQTTETSNTDLQNLQSTSQERNRLLTNYSNHLQSYNDLEKTPAYKRKSIQLNNTQPSTQNNASEFTHTKNEDGTFEVRKNNPFFNNIAD